MDSRADKKALTAALKLLALCARTRGGREHAARLAAAAASIEHWEPIPDLAEDHGLAPLVYHHLKQAGVAIPPRVNLSLQGLYLRHRRDNRTRARALGRVVLALRQKGIEPVVLKGMALAHLVYPDPGLRPMCDIDLLIQPCQRRTVKAVLKKLGEAELSWDLHYPTSGLALPSGWSGRRKKSADAGPSLAASTMATFEADGVQMHSLGPEDLILFLALHLGTHWPRLIWRADLVSAAEKHCESIDWQRLQQQAPAVIGALCSFHATTPLSPALWQAIGPAKEPRGPAVDRGLFMWPQRQVKQCLAGGLLWFLRDTFFPPGWWLRLRFHPQDRAWLWLRRWMLVPLGNTWQAAAMLPGRFLKEWSLKIHKSINCKET